MLPKSSPAPCSSHAGARASAGGPGTPGDSGGPWGFGFFRAWGLAFRVQGLGVREPGRPL